MAAASFAPQLTLPRLGKKEGARRLTATMSQVCALIRIDALRKQTTHEWNCMVLVITLTIAQDRVARQLHAILGLPDIRTLPGAK